MSQAHGDGHHEHDAHHEEEHGDHNSHSLDEHHVHDDTHHDGGHEHGDDHGHSEHDEDGHHGHDEHDIMHEEEIDETGTIHPAGTINDILPPGMDLEVDIAVQYPLSDILTVDHNPGSPLFDLTLHTLQSLNLSFIPKVTLEKLKTPKYKDLFKESEFQPISPFDFFVQKYIKRKKHLENTQVPRYETISIQKPISFDVNSVDIRNAENLQNREKSHIDIYLLPLPFSKKFQRYLVREKIFLLKITATCIGGCLVFITCIGGSLWYTKYALEKGIAELQGIRPTMDAKVASNSIHRASDYFYQARILGKTAHIIGVFGYKKEANNLLNTTEGFAAISEILVAGDSLRVSLIKEEYASYSGDYISLGLFTNRESKYTDFIIRHRQEFVRIYELLGYAGYRFSSIHVSDFDTKTLAQIQKLILGLQKIESVATFIQAHSNELLTLVGNERPMKYLLLNQNKDEIRANGGFPGSAIEFELYKGRLQKHTKRDIYYYDWHLYPYAETPPPGISEITKAYGIRDANYEPDFADSFTTINRFFEKSGGNTLDGAFAIHQGLVEKILVLTGPVTVPGVTEPFTHENFSRNMSLLVETEFGRKNSPKDILFEFMDELVNTIHAQNLYNELFSLVASEIQEGQIVGYVRDLRVEQFIKTLQKPYIYEVSNDFIFPVFTSISGNKSDRYMKRDFTLTSTSTGNCIKQNTLEIRSDHQFSPQEERTIRDTFIALGIDPKKIQEELMIQGKGANKQYVRLIVPKNALLVRSTFKKIDTIRDHEKYDMFTFGIDVNVGEISKESITYSLPEGTCKNETQFTTQPGLLTFTFNLR